MLVPISALVPVVIVVIAVMVVVPVALTRLGDEAPRGDRNEREQYTAAGDALYGSHHHTPLVGEPEYTRGEALRQSAANAKCCMALSYSVSGVPGGI